MYYGYVVYVEELQLIMIPSGEATEICIIVISFYSNTNVDYLPPDVILHARVTCINNLQSEQIRTQSEFKTPRQLLRASLLRK